MKKICEIDILKRLKQQKKAFTLIEVILALIIAAMASVYVIKTLSQNDFNEAVVEVQNTVKFIVQDGIVSENGYASGRDGNCSANIDFTGLTTVRLQNCLDWNSRFTLVGNSLTGKGLLHNYGGCSLATQVDPRSDIVTGTLLYPRRFYVYVDCSNAVYNDRSVLRLEEAVKFAFESELIDVFLSIDDNANGMTIDPTTGLNTSLSGTTTDGKIGAWFEL